MSTPKKWKASGIPISWDLVNRFSAETIIYDTLKHRATQLGILWGMPFRTVRAMVAQKRYQYADRIES